MIGQSRPLVVLPLVALALGCLLALRPRLQAAAPGVVPFRASGIYGLGEKAGWTVSLPEGATPTKLTYTLKRNNAVVIGSGELNLDASGKATVETTEKEPAMLFLQIGPAGSKPMSYGAAVAPTKLRPVAPKPNDFDAFWKRKLAELHAVPENPILTPGDSYRPEVEYATIRMDHVNGTHVYGQLAKPKKPGKYPAMVVLQWASPPYPLQPAWAIEPASQGWLVLNIEPHDVLPTEPAAYYAALPSYQKNYGTTGWDDREKSAFVEMYLRDVRAVEYLAKRPDWDGKTLVVTGTSMGGQQSLVAAGLCPQVTHLMVNEPAGCDLNAGLHGRAAGLCPQVTHLMVNEPAGCDLNAGLHGRQEGYPFFPTSDPKVMETARYVDPVNFSSRIRATSLVAMGFVDDAAPPTGIWTAFNEIRGKKEAASMVDSPHNNLATPEQQRPWSERSAAWFAALVKGEKAPVQ